MNSGRGDAASLLEGTTMSRNRTSLGAERVHIVLFLIDQDLPFPIQDDGLRDQYAQGSPESSLFLEESGLLLIENLRHGLSFVNTPGFMGICVHLAGACANRSFLCGVSRKCGASSSDRVLSTGGEFLPIIRPELRQSLIAPMVGACC